MSTARRVAYLCRNCGIERWSSNPAAAANSWTCPACLMHGCPPGPNQRANRPLDTTK